MRKLYIKIVRYIFLILSKFPLKFHYFMGDILSWTARNIMRYRYEEVTINISRAFPKRRYKGVRQIISDFYTHFGELFAETVWFSGSSYARLRKEGIAEIANPEVLSRLYDNAPSVTLLCTHCGNWELLGGLFGYRTLNGGKLSMGEKDTIVAYKAQKNPVMDEVFRMNRTNPLKEVGIECTVESRNILRYSIKNKAEKKLYIYPADQAPYAGTGKFPIGNFLNQNTYAMAGSIGVACKLSHAVAYMKMKRVRRGYYEISFIPICENASLMSQEDILRKYYDLLEEEITETPANWLWSHRRWKKQ